MDTSRSWTTEAPALSALWDLALHTSPSSCSSAPFTISFIKNQQMQIQASQSFGSYSSKLKKREKGLQEPLIRVHPKGNQSWIVIGRTDADTGAPILWPPDVKSWLTGKDPDAGKDWGQEEKGVTEEGWMASSAQWTWVWANSGRWWRTRKPGVLLSKGLQRAGHELATKQQLCSLDSVAKSDSTGAQYLWLRSKWGQSCGTEPLSLWNLTLTTRVSVRIEFNCKI